MKQSLATFIAIFYTTLLVTLTVSNVSNAQPNEPLFPINQANRQFDAITIKLAGRSPAVGELKKAVSQLEMLKDKAEQCISKAQDQVDDVEKLLRTDTDTKPEPGKPRVDIQYLNQKKGFYENQLSQCRLFKLRAQESIEAFETTLQALTTSRLLTRKKTLIEVLDKKLLATISLELSTQHVARKIGFHLFSPLASIWLLGLLIVASGVGLMLRRYTTLALKRCQSLVGKVIMASIKPYIIPGLCLIILSVFWRLLYQGNEFTVIELSFYSLFAYILFSLFLKAIFVPPRPGNIWLLKPDLAFLVHRRLSIQLFIVLACLLIMLWQRGLVANAMITNLTSTIAMSIIAISIFWTALLLKRFQWFVTRKWLGNLLIGFLFIGLIATITMEWLGFHNLTTYLLINSLLTLVSICFLAVLLTSISLIFSNFIRKKQYEIVRIPAEIGIRYKFGLEARIIKYIVYITLVYSAFILIINMWGITNGVLKKFIEWTSEGFVVSKLYINPAMIFLGIVLFCVLSILGKILSLYVAKLSRFSGQEDSQIAFAALTRYITFTVALVIGLFIAGVNFTGLAIIAGALSVGIGLGLQDIVNNFVSGIILMLENTIKPGDRITLGTQEGYVKRVHVRYTHISTLAKEDVIVPNSQLVTTPVTNFMLDNPTWRVECNVGVAYGSDIALVIKSLKEVAAENSDVIHDDPDNRPRVIFLEFGDSALQFGLWSVIRDVNKKYNILSQLNIAIDKKFRENKITIAFPQRDVHIINN